jgi:small subunit ribosomal protein S18
MYYNKNKDKDKDRQCFFCQRNLNEIDFKNTQVLEKYISGLGKIKSRKRTFLCAKHQRMLTNAIKRGRYLGILPFTTQ